MVKEVVLRFEIGKDSFKDGNLLLYNKEQQYFYAISPEQFLTKQNQEIKALKKACDERALRSEKDLAEKVKKMEETVEELEKRYNEFLAGYKESNAKLLSMVENFIKVYENGGNK